MGPTCPRLPHRPLERNQRCPRRRAPAPHAPPPAPLARDLGAPVPERDLARGLVRWEMPRVRHRRLKPIDGDPVHDTHRPDSPGHALPHVVVVRVALCERGERRVKPPAHVVQRPRGRAGHGRIHGPDHGMAAASA